MWLNTNALPSGYHDDGDQVLFVDQETQTPYIPTEIDDATIIVDGQQTDEEALVAGNIVQVTGNGIMLESYPACRNRIG